jgi:lysophospholipase L1-like esterase
MQRGYPSPIGLGYRDAFSRVEPPTDTAVTDNESASNTLTLSQSATEAKYASRTVSDTLALAQTVDRTLRHDLSVSGVLILDHALSRALRADRAGTNTLVLSQAAVGARIVAPLFQSANVNSAGTTLAILFDSNVLNSTGFTFLVNGVSSTLSSPVVAGSQISFTVGTVYPGDVLTVSYTPGNVTDSTGTASLAAFAAQTVTNNSTVDFYAALGNQQLALLASEAYSDTSNVTLATTNATLIASLKDMSGNSRHAQNATSGNRPTLQIVGGRKAVKWPGGVSKTLTTPSFLDSTYNTTFTLYLVKEFTGISGPKVLVGGQSTTMFVADALDSGTPGPEIDWFTNGSGSRDYKYGDGNIVAVCLQYNGITKRSEVYAVTGSGQVITSTVTFNLNLSGAITLGDLNQGNSFGWAGFFYALRLFKANHSTGTITSVLQRLRIDHMAEPAAASYIRGAGTKSVITDGDSLTVGQGSSVGKDYPTRLGVGLGASYTVTKGLAVGGQTAGDMNNDAETQIDALYSASYNDNILAAWGGTNDIQFGLSAAVAYARYRDYCLRRKAKGFKVIAFTVLPRSDGGGIAGVETRRTALNTLIRAHYLEFADALADVAADSRIGDSGDELNLTYYQTDKVHLSDAGYQIIADIVQPIVVALAA